MPQRARTEQERLQRKYLTIEDLRQGAKRHLPGSVFDYIDGGGDDETSLRRNEDSYGDYSFIPRWGSVNYPDVSTTILGTKSELPLFLSPTGGTRLFRPEGERAVIRGAARAGVPYGLASLSNTTMEDVAAAAPEARRWFNMKPKPDPRDTQALLDRVSASGYEALLVNIDARTIGHRERDYRNGFTAPPTIRFGTVLEGVVRPAWSLGFLLNEAVAFPNLTGDRPEGPMTSTPEMWRSLMGGGFVPLGWDDLADLRERWDGKIVLKGCVNADDIVQAADIGFDAVQISNHGGRQLDHMASPLDVLPDIVDRVAGRMEIYVDGGIRRGTDVVKALALGADAVAIGRPYLYGLAAEGEAGVVHAIDLFRQEITRTLCLLGCDSIAEVRERGTSLLKHRAMAPARIG
ncbi:alpha-hydroxy acid oxidase [Paeniglutamicibacter psychrophenolicus]|uniref:L-lactate dehydrogenase (Cytochrome) n=2 Tax=Paeniglutamicibacter psychrophenolicus TaxID=257454 RepID=A0ABS4W9N2_9MICC|nr:alpha-hydroxy acid oxidase [Paeniglutamicibacter psychrophenolicus]MBP2372919.1 L-lactate dehydrogenase (cytochrome) [Paeniglutamicibacter psychrophenolicus]